MQPGNGRLPFLCKLTIYSKMKKSRLMEWGCTGVCMLGALVSGETTEGSPRPATEAVVALVGDTRVTEKGVLDEVLLFVVDKKSADDAAPAVQKLLLKHADLPQEMMLSEYDRSLLSMTSCFSSVQLEKALSPIFDADAQYQESLAPYIELQQQLGQMLDDMATVLTQVQNKADADAAAEMAANVPGYMESLREKVAALPNHDDSALLRARVRSYHVTVRPGAARLLQAWGKLATRNADFYGSIHLLEALPHVYEVLENLGMAADPAVLPQLVEIASHLEPLLEEWLDVSKTIKDKASADAAAPRLLKLAQKVRSVSIDKLGSGYEKDLSNVSPRLQILMMATDRVSHWLEDLPTPFYGSELLRSALEHDAGE